MYIGVYVFLDPDYTTTTYRECHRYTDEAIGVFERRFYAFTRVIGDMRSLFCYIQYENN